MLVPFLHKKFVSIFFSLQFLFFLTGCQGSLLLNSGNILNRDEMIKFIKMYDFQVIEEYWGKESGIITKQEVDNKEFPAKTVWYSFLPLAWGSRNRELKKRASEKLFELHFTTGKLCIGDIRLENGFVGCQSQRHYRLNEKGAVVLTGGLNRYVIGIRKDLKILTWYNDIEFKISDSKIIQVVKKKPTWQNGWLGSVPEDFPDIGYRDAICYSGDGNYWYKPIETRGKERERELKARYGLDFTGFCDGI